MFGFRVELLRVLYCEGSDLVLEISPPLAADNLLKNLSLDRVCQFLAEVRIYQGETYLFSNTLPF